MFPGPVVLGVFRGEEILVDGQPLRRACQAIVHALIREEVDSATRNFHNDFSSIKSSLALEAAIKLARLEDKLRSLEQKFQNLERLRIADVADQRSFVRDLGREEFEKRQPFIIECVVEKNRRLVIEESSSLSEKILRLERDLRTKAAGDEVSNLREVVDVIMNKLDLVVRRITMLSDSSSREEENDKPKQMSEKEDPFLRRDDAAKILDPATRDRGRRSHPVSAKTASVSDPFRRQEFQSGHQQQQHTQKLHACDTPHADPTRTGWFWACVCFCCCILLFCLCLVCHLPFQTTCSCILFFSGCSILFFSGCILFLSVAVSVGVFVASVVLIGLELQRSVPLKIVGFL